MRGREVLRRCWNPAGAICANSRRNKECVLNCECEHAAGMATQCESKCPRNPDRGSKNSNPGKLFQRTQILGGTLNGVCVWPPPRDGTRVLMVRVPICGRRVCAGRCGREPRTMDHGRANGHTRRHLQPRVQLVPNLHLMTDDPRGRRQVSDGLLSPKSSGHLGRETRHTQAASAIQNSRD